MNFAQVQQHGVKLSILILYFSFQSLKWKLDLLLRVEDFLDKSPTEVHVTLEMIQWHSWGDLRLLN